MSFPRLFSAERHSVVGRPIDFTRPTTRASVTPHWSERYFEPVYPVEGAPPLPPMPSEVQRYHLTDPPMREAQPNSILGSDAYAGLNTTADASVRFPIGDGGHDLYSQHTVNAGRG
jgi:hypothetical protein